MKHLLFLLSYFQATSKIGRPCIAICDIITTLFAEHKNNNKPQNVNKEIREDDLKSQLMMEPLFQ